MFTYFLETNKKERLGEVADMDLSCFSLEENGGRTECVCICVHGECPCTLRDFLEMRGVSWQDGLGLGSRSITVTGLFVTLCK